MRELNASRRCMKNVSVSMRDSLKRAMKRKPRKIEIVRHISKNSKKILLLQKENRQQLELRKNGEMEKLQIKKMLIYLK